jgi:hypothetical protein
MRFSHHTPATSQGTVTALDQHITTQGQGSRTSEKAYAPGDRVGLAWTDTSGRTRVATVTLIAGPVA